MPGSQLASEVSAELTFLLPFTSSQYFPTLLDRLERENNTITTPHCTTLQDDCEVSSSMALFLPLSLLLSLPLSLPLSFPLSLPLSFPLSLPLSLPVSLPLSLRSLLPHFLSSTFTEQQKEVSLGSPALVYL